VLETPECFTCEADASGAWGQAPQEREAKMKRGMIALTVLFVFTFSAFAEVSTGQVGGMMGGGWGWGMNSGGLFVVVIAFLVILGVVYMTKRK